MRIWDETKYKYNTYVRHELMHFNTYPLLSDDKTKNCIQ